MLQDCYSHAAQDGPHLFHVTVTELLQNYYSHAAPRMGLIYHTIGFQSPGCF